MGVGVGVRVYTGGVGLGVLVCSGGDFVQVGVLLLSSVGLTFGVAVNFGVGEKPAVPVGLLGGVELGGVIPVGVAVPTNSPGDVGVGEGVGVAGGCATCPLPSPRS